MKLNALQQNLHDTALKLADSFRKTESALIDVLLQVDEARVYLALGYSSPYAYAHEALGLSEGNAYAFTSVARKSLKIPELKAEIQSGNLSVSKAKRILSVITPENKTEWLSKAATLSKAELEREVIKANPEVEKRESVRPISEDRYSLKLGISHELLKKLKRAQVLLMNKKRKNLSLEQTLEALADGFLEKQDPLIKAKRILGRKVVPATKTTGELDTKLCLGTKIYKNDQSELVKNPMDPIKGVPGFFHPYRSANTYKRKPLPAGVRYGVFHRDEGQCQFLGAAEKKCGGMAYVETHHKRSVSKGGSNDLGNLTTLCSKHHRYLHEAR